MTEYIGIILLIPAAIFAFWAQMRVNSAYRKYSKIGNAQGLTGADAARFVLDKAGLEDVPIECIGGELTDHYDPRVRVLRLSQAVYGGANISSVGVACHEAGHAIQHEQAYMPLGTRNAILPVAKFGSYAAWPLVILGLFIGAGGWTLINIGVILFTVVVAFQLVTLPVEFNASNRAVALIEDYGLLTGEELYGAKRVLNAAALTYVAAVAVSIANLIRLILIRDSRRN